MPTRWEVEEAVLSSSLDPIGRHILLTLLTKSNPTDAQIPPRFTPTFTDMETLTGCSRSTLIDWMKALTDGRWIRRTNVEGESRNGFAIEIGDPSAARPKRSRASKTADAAYRHAVRDGGSGVPARGTDRTGTRYDDVPAGGTPAEVHLIKNSPTESSTTTTNLDQPAAEAADATDGFAGVDFGPRVAAKSNRKTTKPKTTKPKSAPGEETEGQKINRIARLYTDVVKLAAFMAVQGVVRTAVTCGDYTEDQVIAGITALRDRRDPVSATSLRIAIEGSPSWADRNANGRRGSHWQQPADDSEYDRPFSGAQQ